LNNGPICAIMIGHGQGRTFAKVLAATGWSSGTPVGIVCIYKTPREACVEVCKAFYRAENSRRLYTSFQNRLDPYQSEFWWLSPSLVHAGYGYGKMAFLPRGEDEMSVGLIVEKGLGRGAATADRTMMDSTWIWHDFLSDMEHDRLLSALSLMSPSEPVLPEIHIEGGFLPSGSGATRENWARFEYLWHTATRTLLLVRAVRQGPLLCGLEKCSSMPCLAAELSKVSDKASLWIDLFVGVRVGLGVLEAGSWDAARIVSDILEPFGCWVR